jgi:hypothetical protein
LKCERGRCAFGGGIDDDTARSARAQAADGVIERGHVMFVGAGRIRGDSEGLGRGGGPAAIRENDRCGIVGRVIHRPGLRYATYRLETTARRFSRLLSGGPR